VQAFAGDYVGEYCWKIIDPENDANYVIGKFAVTHMGDGHFLLNGTFTNFDDNAQQQIDVAHGNAEIVDSMIVVTLVNTYYVSSEESEEYGNMSVGSSEEYGFSMINFQLNPSTLSGTFRTIDTGYQFSFNKITIKYGEGPLEFLPTCSMIP
jgi:hypothetical protein